MEVESQTATGMHWRQAFPPGTVRVEDKLGDYIVLSPQPSSDPNEPLVRPHIMPLLECLI